MLEMEELSAKFGDLHPGLDLVAIIPVGIPLNIYDVEITVYEAKEYPLLNEYVLKCLELGLNTITEIASFLGVDLDFVADAVAHEESTLGTVSIFSDGNLAITSFGRKKLEDLTINESRKITKRVHVDLVSGDVTYFRQIETNVDKLAKLLHVMKGEEYVRKLEAVHKEKRKVSDFGLAELDLLIGDATGSRKIHVLEVLSSKKAKHNVHYSLGQIMVFADASGQGVILNMTVDGERKTEHDRILSIPKVREALDVRIQAEPALPSAGQIFQELFRTKSASALDVVRKLAELPEAESLVTNELLEAETPSPSSIDKLNPLGPDIFRVQLKPVRLKVEDHPRIRREAVRFAKERLVIVCPWVKRGATNEEFLTLLEQAAIRGVKIDIAIGYKEDLSDSHDDALAKLADLSKQNSSNFRLHKWRSHEKVLLVDETYVETSFNWLSFAGVTDNYYRRERGTKIVNKEIADEVYAELLQAIWDERDPDWVF